MSAMFIALLAIALGAAAPPIQTVYDAESGRVIVPSVEGRAFVLDGTFSPGEWDGAVRYQISKDIDLYLAADGEALRIGLKYGAPSFFRQSDIFIASNPREFLLFHASAALMEARLAFPCRNPGPSLEFRTDGWDANYLDEGAAPAKIDGNEFRILRKRVGGERLRFAIQLEHGVFYPAAAGLKSPDGWVELILPPLKTPSETR